MKIRYMNVPKKQIEQVKEWKKIPRDTRDYRCPFKFSATGGKICCKAFTKCNYKPDKDKVSPRRIVKQYKIKKPKYYCKTSPCPCGIYSFGFIMAQASRIIKYGRI